MSQSPSLKIANVVCILHVRKGSSTDIHWLNISVVVKVLCGLGRGAGKLQALCITLGTL